MRLDELYFEIRLERRTRRDSSSRRMNTPCARLYTIKRRMTRRTTNVCPSSSRRTIGLKYIVQIFSAVYNDILFLVFQ